MSNNGGNGSNGGNGNGHKPADSIRALTGSSQPSEKVLGERTFPVASLADVLAEIRRTSGTGKLELHFRNGQARGEAKWQGYSKPSP